jgi:hypothetical protein
MVEQNDEQTVGDIAPQESDYPFIEVDMRLFGVVVAGTSDDSIEDIEEVADRQVQQRLEEVRKLKRHDRELDKEFMEDDGISGGPYQQ